MPTRTTRPFNPLKFLLGALLCCALLFGFIVAGAVYWFASFRDNRVRLAQRPPIEPVQTQHAIQMLGLERPSPSQIPISSFTNAILASKNIGALPGDDLFRDLHIPRLRITVPREGISRLTRNGPYIPASIQEGDTVYKVALRLKGGPGSFRPFNDRPSLTINFDKFAPGQTFHGLKKIHLNSSVQDSSYLEEKISRELFEAAGVPVPRSGHSHVTINGRQMGIYVLVEGVNKQFLKRYFKDPGGNLYDGHSGTDVTTSRPEINSGEDPNRTGLNPLARAVAVADLDERLAAIERSLDLDRFLSFMAMEMILWHWDGYTMHRNNFRMFHDRDADRIVFIPQGMDQMLNDAQGPVIRQTSGLVARSILEIPEARRRYLQRVAELSTTVFVPELINDRIDEVSQAIYSVLAETDPSAAETHLSRASSLRRKVIRRADYLERQFFPVTLTEFDAEGIAPLKDWKPRRDLGDADFGQDRGENGSTLLRISSENGCTASWRTTALLNSGTYRLEARIKTSGVVLDPSDQRAGAGLRISRHRTGQKNEGENDWMPVEFEFSVDQDQAEVELVCELRADKGEIWYDLESLRLRRLQSL